MNADDKYEEKMHDLIKEIYFIFNREGLSPSDGLGVLTVALLLAAIDQGRSKAEILNRVGDSIDMLMEDMNKKGH